MSKFPIDLSKYSHVKIDPWAQEVLTSEQMTKLQANIQLCRDAIVFFTACGAASGYGGHTGGAYDTVPELMLLDAFFRGRPDRFVPIFFDEAGHRVASQYLMAVLHGEMKADQLMLYRRGHAHLPGHPELGCTPGVKFSSGRLGHMWPYVNGVSMANKDKIVFCLGSDGSQMEGNDAEAARLAVAQNLNVKLIIDDNDVTIAGHPSKYMAGYSVQRTLEGHGLAVAAVSGEDISALYRALRSATISQGPSAVIAKRSMAPGIDHVQGTTHGHDAIPVKYAIPYLEAKGYVEAVKILKTIQGTKDPYKYQGSSSPLEANRAVFGVVVSDILDTLPPMKKRDVMVIDCDLEGSTGLNTIHQRHPDIFVAGGIMERGNISAAAGFGMEKGKQGIFSTFAAFLEMSISELTMARLNKSNLLCHFSHSGVDDMADNTCHFGLNNFYADNGLADQHPTTLYFPADANQMKHCVRSVFFEEGLRFIFSTRSKLPQILGADGQPFYGDRYVFTKKDDVLREGSHGYIVTFGDALYRALDASEQLKKRGVHVGVINKHTLNKVDEAALALVGRSPLVVVVEPFNANTGLGIRFGTWLIERGLHPKYAHIGTHREGSGGLWEQAYHQGYDSVSIQSQVLALAQKAKL